MTLLDLACSASIFEFPIHISPHALTPLLTYIPNTSPLRENLSKCRRILLHLPILFPFAAKSGAPFLQFVVASVRYFPPFAMLPESSSIFRLEYSISPSFQDFTVSESSSETTFSTGLVSAHSVAHTKESKSTTGSHCIVEE